MGALDNHVDPVREPAVTSWSKLVMLKLRLFPLLAGSAAAALAGAAVAAPVGPYASVCAAGKPAVLARVSGFKSATGIVSVKLYASNSSFLEEGAYLRKVEAPVTRRGPIDVCVPVPRAGNYAISVRHELGRKKSRSDGGGISGNPPMRLVDVLLGRKPKLAQVSFHVNGTTKVVPVVLKYLQGASIKPVSA